jgi:hypothetical protein
MMRASGDAKFYVLTAECEAGVSSYVLRPWRSAGAIEIDANGQSTEPDKAGDIVTNGVPMPRDGSLFGWNSRNEILTLIVFYAEYTPVTPEPGWAVMPRAGTAQLQWPPFTEQAYFGDWFWDYFRSGSVISLDNSIAETSETVFWIDTEEALGWDSCAVAQDVRLPGELVLPRGLYVFYPVLSSGRKVPSLDTVLCFQGKLDLGPTFGGL